MDVLMVSQARWGSQSSEAWALMAGLRRPKLSVEGVGIPSVSGADGITFDLRWRKAEAVIWRIMPEDDIDLLISWVKKWLKTFPGVPFVVVTTAEIYPSLPAEWAVMIHNVRPGDLYQWCTGQSRKRREQKRKGN